MESSIALILTSGGLRMALESSKKELLTELDLFNPSSWYDVLVAARVQCVPLRIAEAAEQMANVDKVEVVVSGPVTC